LLNAFIIAATVAIVWSVKRDCYEVCADQGMVFVEKSYGCAVACLCRPEVKRGQ
jgi:hypothetical protein